MKLTSAIALCGLLSQVSAKMVVGYFPNWLYANYPVEKIPVNKYTHINYAFAILNKDDMVPAFTDDWAVESSLPKLVNNTHSVGSKVLLSVGGWTGSIKFSKMVAMAEHRKKFIDWNLNFISKYNTDGVDIDWEYPGRQAAGCNEFDAKNDASNFLLLLKELRAALDQKFPGQHKEITMAVHVYPFQTENGYMKSVKDFVPFFDHINIMSYDINGAWASTTGPNSPLYHEEGKGEQVSFASSIKNWIDAGVPAEKINAGLAYYGRSMQTVDNMKDTQYVSSVKGAPKGDSDDAYWQDPSCHLDEGGFSGIWKYTNLRSQGILDRDGKPGAGYTKHWDPISSTPWLFNEKTKTFISYEDKDSLMHKVELALCLDIGGVMAWDIHQDNGELMEAVQMINGKKPAACPTLKDLAAKKGPDNGSKVPDPDVAQHKEDTPIQAASASVEAVIMSTMASVESVTMTSSVAAVESVPAQADAANSTTEEPKMPEVGMSCTTGHMKCANRGETPEYHECVNGLLMTRLCAEGTVCNTNGDSIICNYPTEEVAKKLAAKINPTTVGPNVEGQEQMKETETQAASDGMIQGTILAVDMDATRQKVTSAQVGAATAADATPEAKVAPIVDDAMSVAAGPAMVPEAKTLPQLDDHIKEAVQKSYDIQESIFYDVFEGIPVETYTASKPMATGSI